MASLTMLSTGAHAQLPTPSKGWNLGNTLESTWGGPAPTQALINSVAAQGFNTIRIPCAWNYNSTNGTINSSYMSQVTQVVNWCTAKGMYVVLNDHWDNNFFQGNSFASYDSNLNNAYMNMWTQVANNFKNYDGHVLFACTNEPQATSQSATNVMFQYYRNWVTTIRNTGGNNATRWLVLQGPTTNIDNTCSWVTSSIWPNDPAKHLMIEVHFYDPFQWTQLTSDASWGNMFYFWGAAYHVTSGPTNRNATWGEESYVDSEFAKMKTQWVNAGIPVLVGEFQAHAKPSESDLTGQYITQNYNNATYWNYYVQTKANANGLYETYWTIPGQDFDWTTGNVVDQNLINAALGKSYLPSVFGGSGSVTNGTYKIINRNSGLAMDASSGGTANGTQIIQWSYGGGSNQKWTVTNTGGSNYKIIGVQSGRSLDINGFSSANGAKVQLWDYAGGTNQTFTFTATDNGNYRITPNCATGSCLDVTGGSTSNGANVQLWGYTGSNNQQWKFLAP
jgi:endoglucanase